MDTYLRANALYIRLLDRAESHPILLERAFALRSRLFQRQMERIDLEIEGLISTHIQGLSFASLFTAQK